MRIGEVWFVVVFLHAMLHLFGCNKGKNDPDSCNGKTRRPVKVVIDDRVNEIDTIPIPARLDSLGKIVVPEVKWETGRQDLELQTYTVRAKVHKLSKERDGDYHIRLIDDNENYLICEAPNPGCSYARQSRYLQNYIRVREFLDQNKKTLEGKTITLTGVAFIDIDHYYKRKQAENNLELHPVLAIHF
ncbi:MAG: hypothetical protein ACK40M_07510 [Flavobacteriales bacterium]